MRSCGVHVALAQERTLRGSSQGANLCFSAFWHAIDVLGCRVRWWTPTGALPIECSEHNAISMLSLCVSGCFMQLSKPLSSLLCCRFVPFDRLRKKTRRFVPRALCQFSHCALLQNMHAHAGMAVQLNVGSATTDREMWSATSCIIGW